MKILFFLGCPNPFPGAAWTRIGFFADAWSRRGHSVDVLGAFNHKKPQKRGAGKIGEVNIFNLILNIGSSHPLIFVMSSTVSFIVSTLFLLAKKPNITVVSVPSGDDAGLGALIACKLLKAKYVVDYRDEWEDYVISLTNHKAVKLFYSITRKLAACLYAESQLIVTVTPNFMEALKQRGLNNVKLIPNGADVRTFKPLSNKKENEVFTAFYSGGVGGYYRLDMVVKSIKKFVDKGPREVKLVIAGAGEVQEVFKLALELGVSNIEYKGVISNKAKLAHLISKAHVGLIPYDDNTLWKNSLPAKFFEYCSCGIPVIATVYEDSLLATLIREYEIGVTSPPMNQEELVKAIYRIYEDKPFREAAGKRARLLIEEKFDRTKIAEIFLALIEDL